MMKVIIGVYDGVLKFQQ